MFDIFRERRENYASRAALEAAATPTSRATTISTDAIVVAEEVSEAETVAMKERPAMMIMMAIAITYPRMGRTVSNRPITFIS
jgi:hypothetical protein